MLVVMPTPDAKAELKRYPQIARDALLWKLEGLSEYDVRRPLVRSGTNLLGLVKHVAGVDLGYFADTFGRAHGESVPWLDEGAGQADITRELIDGAAGLSAGNDNMASGDAAWWSAYHARLQHAAGQFLRD